MFRICMGYLTDAIDDVYRTCGVVQLLCVHCWDPQSRCCMLHGLVTHRHFWFAMVKAYRLWIPINQRERYGTSCMCEEFIVVWKFLSDFWTSGFALVWQLVSYSAGRTAAAVEIFNCVCNNEEHLWGIWRTCRLSVLQCIMCMKLISIIRSCKLQ